MTQRQVLDLIVGIASEDEAARDRAADEVTDIHRALDEADVDVVAGVLVVARLAEPVQRCQEAQLHALAELAEWHDLRPELVSRLSRIARPVADPSQEEYLDGLLPLDGS